MLTTHQVKTKKETTKQQPSKPRRSMEKSAVQQTPLWAQNKPIQRRSLTVNTSNDAYEQEAEMMATQVMRMPAQSVQRRCACGGITGADGECVACKAKRLQRMSDGSSSSGGKQAPASVKQTIRKGGSPLDSATRSFMETRFGQNFGNVRVHTDSHAAQSAADVDAKAYTVGHNIVFNQGAYQPQSDSGKHLIAHELTHVMQQQDVVIPQVIQRDERHERGHAGEQNIGFILYRQEDGWATIRGPSGAGGHRINAGGEDGLFYNVRTRELHITDNKSLTRRGNVSSATAIDPTVNLRQNVQSMIREVSGMSTEQLPMRQEVLRLLRQTNAALRDNTQLPGRVSLIVSNAGGQSTGVTARLRRLGVRFININQPVTTRPGTARPAISGGSRATSTPASSATPVANSTGGSQSTQSRTSASQTRATVGTPATPVQTGGLSARGQAKVSALGLALDAGHFILGIFAERHQAERAQQALSRISPTIEAHLQQHPTLGALVRLNYAQNKQGGTPRFLNITYGYGQTTSEARQDLARRERNILRARPNSDYETPTHSDQWIRPKQRTDILNLQTPFPIIGNGIFAVNENRLQGVEWGGVSEFDDLSESSLQDAGTPRFLILQPPKKITWYNGRFPRTETINIVTRNSDNGIPLKAVDLDPITPFGSVVAVPIFPMTRQTQILFNTKRATRDNLGQLRQFTNISEMRWARPGRIWVMKINS